MTTVSSRCFEGCKVNDWAALPSHTVSTKNGCHIRFKALLPGKGLVSAGVQSISVCEPIVHNQETMFSTKTYVNRIEVTFSSILYFI